MLRRLLLSEPRLRPGEAMRPARGAFALLATEFPTLTVRPLEQAGDANVLWLDAQAWRAPGFDPFDWDEHVFGATRARRHRPPARVGHLAVGAAARPTR